MSRAPLLDTLLLLALPASGKSEVRRYLHHVPPEDRVRLFHLAKTTQLDDFPYVHFFRMVDESLVSRGQERVFFKGPNDRSKEPRDWGTLLKLVNDDFAIMKEPSLPAPGYDPTHLMHRIDAARKKVGAQPVFESMPAQLRADLASDLEPETRKLVDELFKERPTDISNRTVVIEFARGGPEGSSMPIEPPHGYRWNLSQLSPQLLRNAAILYIWVTPEESRRKNLERADPDDPGSILHHSAPESVMRQDYGCDDMHWLIRQSDRPNTVKIEAHGRTWYLPVAVFDNREDKTTFVRDDPSTWPQAKIQALHQGLVGAFRDLWSAYEALHG